MSRLAAVPLSVPAVSRRQSRTSLPMPAMVAAIAVVLIATLGGAIALTSGPSHGVGRPGKVASSSARTELPADAELAVSRGLGGDLKGFWASAAAGGYVARDASRDLSASFDRWGATIAVTANRRTVGGRVAMSLRAVGYGSSLRSLGAAHLSAHENRVTYGWGGVDEWYANGPLGVEQGFDVDRPLAAHPAGPLTLSLGQSGTLHAKLAPGGRAVLYESANGRAVLRYDGLRASDADGRALPAWLSVRGGRVLVRVDTRGASYPVHVDPIFEDAELTAGDGATEDDLGTSVAVSGSTIVAGAPQHSVGGHGEAGAAYVFSEPASGGWANATQTAELTANDGAENDFLGTSVAISGSTIVAGAPNHQVKGLNAAGAAYVFTEPASGGWTDATQTAELTAKDGVAGDQLAHSVAISGSTIVAGAPSREGFKGAAYVFSEPASGGWVDATETAELTAKDGAGLDALGAHVVVSGTTIVVDSGGHAVNGHSRAGAEYVFSEPPGGWATATQTAELTAKDGAVDDQLGAIAIAGSTIVAGSSQHKVSGLGGAGAVYVFSEPPSGGWVDGTETAELTAKDPGEEAQLGVSVAISGTTILAGAPFDTPQGHAKQGAVYEFSEPASGGWVDATETEQLIAKDGASGDELGFATAMSGSTVVSGDNGHEVAGHLDQGAAYVFTPAPSATITTPAEGATYTQGEAVSASYACTPGEEATLEPGSAGCSGPVANGAPIDTSTPGSYTFTVTATDVDGQTGTASTSYTVTAAQATKTGPASTSTTSTATAALNAGPSVPAATPPTPAALACTTAQVALIDVVPQGSHVLITGAARLILAGRTVSIELLGTKKVVATARVESDGSFSASASLPPAKIRSTNLARYEASVGADHSQALKLDRRAYLVSAKRTGKSVLIAGHVTGSFRAGTPVQITLRVTCAKYRTVATVKLSRSGSFSAKVAAPSAAEDEIAVYRAHTTVLQGKHPEPTYTLPTPPSSATQ